MGSPLFVFVFEEIRLRSSLFLIALLLSSAGCRDAREIGRQSNADSGVPQVSSSSATVAASSLSGEGEGKAVTFEDNEEQDGGSREFKYSWPATVGAQADLAEKLDAERREALAKQKSEWGDALAKCPGDSVGCKSRGYGKEWKVVADLPRWLSLSADIYDYQGGAHGNYTRQSLVWDKQDKRAFAGKDLFQSAVALENALGERLCDALDRERQRKRGAPVERSNEWSTDCPGIDEASVFVGSSNGETFDRIGVYFGPYVAGAYAEGAYELDFPVTASVVDAVKREFASAFSVKR